ncbi:MAG: cytochrome c biogenesis protein ResB [Bacteriovoracaceae bacterium]
MIHSGLLILFLGSFVTYYSGVDGSITLLPNEPTRDVFTSEDELRMRIPAQNKEIRFSLPYTAFERDLEVNYGEFRISKFIPFASDKLRWVKSERLSTNSFRYRISNNFVKEEIVVSEDSRADFSNSIQLGPINIQYLSPVLLDCFNGTKDDILLINYTSNECIASKIFKKLKYNGNVLSKIEFKGKELKFFPEISPIPLNEKMEFDISSPVRMFNKKLFEKGINLFLFGKGVAFFEKGKWQVLALNDGEEVTLPWMNLKFKIMEHHTDAYPTKDPFSIIPKKDEETLKAIKIEIFDKKFWVKSNRPYVFEEDGNKIIFELGKKRILLPYELTLNKFQITTDPGAMTPASFESYISLFEGTKGASPQHVSMNNPLKNESFTFYQSSYFEIDPGIYGSILSVNFDPGRWIKYFGSFLLIIGSVAHYIIRWRRISIYN